MFFLCASISYSLTSLSRLGTLFFRPQFLSYLFFFSFLFFVYLTFFCFSVLLFVQCLSVHYCLALSPGLPCLSWRWPPVAFPFHSCATTTNHCITPLVKICPLKKISFSSPSPLRVYRALPSSIPFIIASSLTGQRRMMSCFSHSHPSIYLCLFLIVILSLPFLSFLQRTMTTTTTELSPPRTRKLLPRPHPNNNSREQNNNKQ